MCTYAETKENECGLVRPVQLNIGEQCGPPKDKYPYEQTLCKLQDRLSCQCNLPPYEPEKQIANRCVIRDTSKIETDALALAISVPATTCAAALAMVTFM